MSTFEPKITTFLCNWCTYTGADLAGTSRLKQPPNVRVIRIPCTGRMDPLFIIKAFERRADAVFVSGCHPADCHYNEGNYNARRKFAIFRELLKFMGIPEDRVHFAWISAAEGVKWQETVTDITEKVRAAGPFRQYQEVSL